MVRLGTLVLFNTMEDFKNADKNEIMTRCV